MAKPIDRRTALASIAGIIAAASGSTGISMPNTETMPALFIGHGTPMNAIMPNEWTKSWATLGASLPRPTTILAISAHWLTQGGTLVTDSPAPKMNYDMYGFPAELYAQKYPAPGNVALAHDLESLVHAHGDGSWGFDHGTWVVLKYLFPKANIPVIQLSIDYSQPPSFHYALAKQLQPLRSKGVMIVGSGNVVHNLGRRTSPDGKPHPWALEFDSKINTYIKDGNNQGVVDFLKLGSVAQMAHPTYDHFLPLIYALGAKHDSEAIHTFVEGFQEPSISMRSFRIG